MVTPGHDSDTDVLTVSDDARATLVHALRVAFPHDSFPDGPYERTADAVIAAAGSSTWSRMSLVQGLSSLDALAGGSFAELSEKDGTRILLHIQDTEFFNLLRRTAVVALYDDHEVWELLGYEGPSFDQGGYLHRGFDDLDWLPDVRIEEYDGPEEQVEVALPGFVGADAAANVHPHSYPGRLRTRAGQMGSDRAARRGAKQEGAK